MRPDPWAGALVLAADDERLAKHQTVVLGDEAAKRQQPATATLTRACRQAWQAATTLTPEASRDVVERFMHVVEDELLTALVLSCGRATVDAPPRGAARVTYLRDWLETNHGIDISTCDMARELGVSVRQLQYAVLAETGHTPSELLRETRLRHARELLLSGDRETTSVSSVALACGFAHLGRFSATYAMRFGETPSTTLRGCA
jgi:AraC-like DNA-binding protein